MDRRTFLTAAGAAMALPAARARAQAPTRAETLLIVQEYGPNSLDMQGIGSAQPVNGVSLNCYDRLVKFAAVMLPDGTSSYDLTKLEPELAESWQVASDGMSVTFKLRPGATFHSGRPVTAKDVKWSLDRAVSIGGFATTQMNAGSMEKPEQFVAVDDSTFRIDYLRRDKLLMPNLGVTIPFVFDAELAQKNAGGDQWAKEYLKNNIAGGGAYKVESWKPGVETIYTRFDEWKNGPLPKLRRIIARDIPSPSTRRALIERGDADMSYGLPPKDFKDLAEAGKIRVSGVPVPNAVWYVAMNAQLGPFKDKRVRQAVAYAMPYDKIMQAALFGRGVPMWGGGAQPTGEKVAAALPLRHRRGPRPHAAGGGRRRVQHVPAVRRGLRHDCGTHGRAGQGKPGRHRDQPGDPEDTRRQLPRRAAEEDGAHGDQPLRRLAGLAGLLLSSGTCTATTPSSTCPTTRTRRWTSLIDTARFTQDPAEYAQNVRGFLAKAMDEVPFIPVCQPLHDVAMQRNIGGYQFWPCREPDFRSLTKA